MYTAKWKPPAFRVQDPAGRIVIVGDGPTQEDALRDAVASMRRDGTTTPTLRKWLNEQARVKR